MSDHETMSQFASKADLYEAKAARLEKENAELRKANDQLFAHGKSMYNDLESLRTESARRLAIIVELDACRELKERADAISPVEPGCEREVLREDYRRRKPRAEAAARAEVEAAQPEGKHG